MLKKAVYEDNDIVVQAEVERIDILLKSEEHILNFPRIVQLEGKKLVLAYGSGRHGSNEGRPAAFSDDFGKTWVPAPPGSPWMDNVQCSGILGYMKDGRIAYIDVTAVEATAKKWRREDGPWHLVHRVEDPTFRLRYFSKTGELLEESTFKIRGLPVKKASYEFYGTLLELDDGSLLTGFHYITSIPDEAGRYNGGIAFCRSDDGGRNFDFLSYVDDYYVNGKPVSDICFSGSDMEILANGDIIAITRDGDMMTYCLKSRDNGKTWSDPVPTGWPGVEPKIQLLSNGVLVCTTGRGVYGHPQITHAMFSLDGTGEKWEYPFAFHTGPGCSYTDLFERDGKLYVVYSHSDFTKPMGSNDLLYQSIKWAVIDVKKEEMKK